MPLGQLLSTPYEPKALFVLLLSWRQNYNSPERALLENRKKSKTKKKIPKPKVNLSVEHLFLMLNNQLQIVMTGLASQDPGILVSFLNLFACVLRETFISW